MRRIIHPRVEHETVELRFRQRIRSFLFNRVLRSEDKKRRGQRIILASDRHRALLHRFEQSRLGLRWRPIDLVCQHDVGKQWTLHELELTLFIENLRTYNVTWHQVRSELHPIELQSQSLRDRVDQKRFGQAGNADKQDVSAGKNGGGHFTDHLILAHDDLSNFLEQLLLFRVERFERFLIRCVHVGLVSGVFHIDFYAASVKIEHAERAAGHSSLKCRCHSIQITEAWYYWRGGNDVNQVFEMDFHNRMK